MRGGVCAWRGVEIEVVSISERREGVVDKCRVGVGCRLEVDFGTRGLGGWRVCARKRRAAGEGADIVGIVVMLLLGGNNGGD